MTVHSPNQIIRTTSGNKAWNLKQLQDTGYPVPDFVVLPTTTTQKLANDPKAVTATYQEIMAALEPHGSYAIRSSSLTEDGQGSAQAGQFHTALNIPANDLVTELQQCLNHPKNQAAAQTGTLALIVQHYLPAELRGVLFTRHPQGKQTTVLEYSRDTSVVAGEAATRIEFHPDDIPTTDFPHLKQLTAFGHELETSWDWPQDIEWLVHDGKLFLLQSRAITSITDSVWKGLQAAERSLSKHPQPYYFEQNILTEQFTHPTPLATSLLQSLYQADGPVATAYQTVGMQYLPQPIHTVIAGALYIDKEAELNSIFPSLSLCTRKFGRPRLASWSGLTTTGKNLLASTFLRTAHTDELYQRIQTTLATPLPETSTPVERWRSFVSTYPLIYEISLRTQKALSLLPRHGNVPHGPVAHPPLDPREYGLLPEQTIGNSLSLDDTSLFSYTLPSDEECSLPNHASARETLRIRARTYLTLREYTRWLVVKHLHYLRQDITSYATKVLPDTPDLIHFTTWDELSNDRIDYQTLQARADTHRQNVSLSPPRTLSSHTVLTKRNVTAGLAPGKADGVICSIADLQRITKSKQILYTTTLYPELTEFFPYIVGIITAEGGILSHLAIMAREHGIPVIKSKIPYDSLHHRLVEIDGDTGTLYTEEGAHIER